MIKVTVTGGDERLRTAAKRLEAAGLTVGTIGLYETDTGCLEDSDAILLPVPTTKDGESVFAPFADRKIYLSEIARRTNSKQLILCCNYRFKEKNCIDYGALDSYSLLNAVPTAEGAIKLAIERTPFTLWRSRVLVIGCGRVGKILAARLAALGCNVTVSARKSADFAMLDTLGIKHINTETLNRSPLEYDIIFNTVDVRVIDDAALSRCTAELIIDLSSKGGLDLSAAKSHGIEAFMAPGLPGITAPRTAGEILADTALQLINSYF